MEIGDGSTPEHCSVYGDAWENRTKMECSSITGWEDGKRFDTEDEN